ncbi:Clavaminate synthase-like protein [Cristinia sonorae]|uniref:Clavaminate synthase-like protein n=1 Tax=Cristinia sonorae TaxID=1940300 RepID=A0A8K0UH75_9AGAR|nr:Clavaminate synthase-like protein [Cristinia sonorae]
MPGLTAFPPFPTDVPTHPLLIVDYQLLLQNDADEINKLWKAATELGFWYLKNHGTDDEVAKMFDMGAETMALPFEEKMRFEQGDEGMSHGYKAAGANATDATGDKDTVEFINIAQDDVLAYPQFVHRTYPSTVNARMESTIIPFVKKSVATSPSGSEARCIKNPPKPEPSTGEIKVAIGAHTDFGSLSFLHNRLGGLQVLPPGYTQWQYVKPIPGHAICNIGDSLAIFSGGILRSNLHRVVPPPRDQSLYERWSLVFFTRPCSSVELRAITEKSQLIEEAVKKAQTPETFNPKSTAGDWFARRIKNQRIKNRTGPETWAASRGTEHAPLVK